MKSGLRVTAVLFLSFSAFAQQAVCEMRAEESGSAGYEYMHARGPSCRAKTSSNRIPEGVGCLEI